MPRAITLVCLMLGVALRTIQYGARTSLWLDELALAHNIVARPLLRLISEPLAYYQVAPAGFLALQRVAIAGLGTSELAFRLVPWIASLLALVLFWRISRRVLGESGASLGGPAAAIGLALFAASPALTAYAGQAKQYSSDVAAVLAVLWAGIELAQPRPRLWIAVAAGTLALLVSMPGVLTGAAVGAVLAWNAARSGRPRWSIVLVTGACWATAALSTVALARLTLSPETAAYMQGFWARGFPPAPWASLEAPFWIPRSLKNTLGFSLFWFVPAEEPLFAAMTWLLALAAPVGAWWFARRDALVASLVIAPIGAAIIAATMRLLPMDTRVSLWMGPLLLLLAAAGFAALGEWLPRRLRALPAVAAGGVVAIAVLSTGVIEPPPFRTQELRPVLRALAAQSQAGDAVYVYYGARLAMRFYGPRVGIVNWTEGRCHRGDTRAYYRELDQFRGRSRVWFIWTHALPRYREPEAIHSYLITIGRELARIDSDPGADSESGAQAVLYDLSDPARLAQASAESHEVPPQNAAERHVPCGGPANSDPIVR